MRNREKYVETSAVITDSLIKSLLVDIRMQAIAAANAQFEYWRTGSYPPTNESSEWYEKFVTTMITLGQLGIDAEWEIGIAPGKVRVATSFTVAGYTPPGIIETIARQYTDMIWEGHDEQDNSCVAEPARAAQLAASKQPIPKTDMEDTTMLTIEFSPAYGTSIRSARRFTEDEKANYVDWYKDVGLVSLGDAIDLPHIGWADLPDRPADGEFPGCSNRAWIITDEDAAAYKQLNAERAQAEAAKQIREQIEHYKRIVKACEAGYMVDTQEQAAQRAAAYNKSHNEGGEGYVPTWYTRSKCDEALAYIAEHDK